MPIAHFKSEMNVMSQTWTLATAIPLAFLGSYLGAGNVWLLLAVLGVMTLEMVTEWGSKIKRRVPGFDPKRNLASKLMLLSLIVVGFILDRVFISLAGPTLSASLDQWMWVTKSTMVWIIIGEIVCILRHVEQSEGEKVIPPVVRWVIRQIRVMDEKRWPHPDGKPPRRWYDDLTDDDISELMKKMEERRKKGEPTEYIARNPKEAVREGLDTYPVDETPDTLGERGET